VSPTPTERELGEIFRRGEVFGIGEKKRLARKYLRMTAAQNHGRGLSLAYNRPCVYTSSQLFYSYLFTTTEVTMLIAA
jgi:hypothetical protein